MTSEGNPQRPPESARSVDRWQRSLRPWLVGVVTLALLFFLVATAMQVSALHGQMRRAPTLDFSTIPLPASTTSPAIELEAYQFRARLELEKHAWAQRYFMAHITMMSRLWTLYAGFVTGMILALVGSAFVLGKLREDVTELSGEVGMGAAKAAKGAIRSSSPGLILVACGTLLMVATMLSHRSIEVKDAALYINGEMIASAQNSATPPRPLHADTQAEDEDRKLEKLHKSTRPTDESAEPAAGSNK